MGPWPACVKFLRGLRGLRWSTFYVGHNFYVGCVGQNFFCVGQFLYVVQNFLRESKFFTWSKFWIESFLEGGSK